jgi:hypothetical protein
LTKKELSNKELMGNAFALKHSSTQAHKRTSAQALKHADTPTRKHADEIFRRLGALADFTVIFAADEPKSGLVLADALNNDIRIVGLRQNRIPPVCPT